MITLVSSDTPRTPEWYALQLATMERRAQEAEARLEESRRQVALLRADLQALRQILQVIP